jgi:hypothetical protein
MIKKLLLTIPLIGSCLASDFVLDGDEALSQKEYQKVVNNYIETKYPQEVKEWKREKEIQRQKEIQRENLINSKTITINGLMWQNDGNYPEKIWEDAKSYCKDLKLLGFDDWRLPNVYELINVFNKGYFRGRFWSGSSIDYKNAWMVQERYDGVDKYNFYKYHKCNIRCVRSVQ